MAVKISAENIGALINGLWNHPDGFDLGEPQYTYQGAHLPVHKVMRSFLGQAHVKNRFYTPLGDMKICYEDGKLTHEFGMQGVFNNERPRSRRSVGHFFLDCMRDWSFGEDDGSLWPGKIISNNDLREGIIGAVHPVALLIAYDMRFSYFHKVKPILLIPGEHPNRFQEWEDSLTVRRKNYDGGYTTLSKEAFEEVLEKAKENNSH